MKRCLFFVLLAGLLQTAAMAQQVSWPFLSLPNETTTGTTQNHLAKATGAPSAAVITAITDISGALGVSVNGGTAGTATIQLAGSAICSFDGGTTAGDYVTFSATVAGDCSDAGALCPATQNIGQVFSTNGGAGTYALVLTIGYCNGGISAGTLPWSSITAPVGSTTLNFGGFNTTFTNAGTFSYSGGFVLPLLNANEAVVTDGSKKLKSAGSGINVFVPNQALFSGTVYFGNGGGSLSHVAPADGQNNTAIGINALLGNTTGCSNTAVGLNALIANTTACDSTAVGVGALGAETTGGGNTAFGVAALQSIVSVSDAVAMGFEAARDNLAAQTTAFGTTALKLNTSGIKNTAVGFGSLTTNTTSAGNTATGWGALNLSTGASNSAFGNSALLNNTTGANNTSVGAESLQTNAGGNNQTAVGFEALSSATGGSNTALGSFAGNNGANATTTGQANTFIGLLAGASSAVQRNSAIALGEQAQVGCDNCAAIGGAIGTGNEVNVGIGMTTPGKQLDVLGTGTRSNLYSTATNCVDSAGAAACGSAAAGAFVIDAAAGSVTVSTTAVTADSEIFVQEDSSLNARLGITCNTTIVRVYMVTARTAGTSFVVTPSAAPIATPACLNYHIVN